MLLICLGITVEVAIILGLRLWWHIDTLSIDKACSGLLLVKLVGDGLEAAESLHWRLVDVLVLKFWLKHCLKESLLGHLLLEHLHLFLLFLDTDVDAVDKNVLVDDIW